MLNDFKAEVGRDFTMTTEPHPGYDGIVYYKVLAAVFSLILGRGKPQG